MEMELFADRDLRADLEDTFRAVAAHIGRISIEQILGTTDQEIIDGLIRDASASCPELKVDETEALPVEEYAQVVGQYGGGGQITHQVPRWRFVIPFTGDRRIFRSRASQSKSSLSRPAALDVREDELELFVDGPTQPDKVRRALDTEIEIVQQYLDWARMDCETHNARLRADVPGLVRQRRQQVEELRSTQAEIGLPIRHRGDPSQIPVPLTRKSVRLSREQPDTESAPSSSTPPPRWVLQDADYEEALRVLGYWRDSLERAPSIADGRGEEEIRDLLLAGLNSVFQGTAAGEVFNGAGKTDILVRQDGVNVFIGECKNWHGDSSMYEALDQIFKYAVWRDTRTAVLLFIHNSDVTAVIQKALEIIRHRENFVSDAAASAVSEYNFVMHAMGDPEQQIRMAFIPFALPPKSSRPGRS
jgi:hypothetical protein